MSRCTRVGERPLGTWLANRPTSYAAVTLGSGAVDSDVAHGIGSPGVVDGDREVSGTRPSNL